MSDKDQKKPYLAVLETGSAPDVELSVKRHDGLADCVNSFSELAARDPSTHVSAHCAPDHDRGNDFKEGQDAVYLNCPPQSLANKALGMVDSVLGSSLQPDRCEATWQSVTDVTDNRAEGKKTVSVGSIKQTFNPKP